MVKTKPLKDLSQRISLKHLEILKNQRPKSFNLRNLLEIANSKLNPDISTIEGLKQHLINWFCFQYGVTEKDDKLLDMTLEELIVLHQMHRIKEDPQYYEEVVNPQSDSYEEWLKQEMGEDYVTTDENVRQMLEEEQDYTKKIRDQFPDEVTTDFSQFKKESD